MPQTDTDDRREIAPARLPDAYAHCAELVREQDQDRYIAGLYAPEDRRAALYALYAFSLEIARVRALVSEPLPGEVGCNGGATFWKARRAARRKDIRLPRRCSTRSSATGCRSRR